MMIRMIRALTLLPLLIAQTALAGDGTDFSCEPPILKSALYGMNAPHSFTIHDNTAYLAHDNKLAIIDLSNPANPHLIADMDIPVNTDFSRGIAVHKDAVYIGGAIINIEHIEEPWFMRWGGLGGGVFFGDLVYSSGIFSFEREFCLANMGVTGFDPDGEYGMTMIDGLLVSTYLRRYDITDPLNPVLVDSSQDQNAINRDGKVVKDEFPHFIFTSYDDTDAIAVHTYDDLSDSFTTRNFSSFNVYDASIRGNILFTTDGALSVYTYEEEPRLIRTETAGPGIESARFIRQIGDHFIIVGDGSIGIYDIPTNPIATASAPGHTNHVEVMNDLVITSTNNLDTPIQSASLFDISDVRNPRRLADFPVDEPYGIAAHNGTAYIAAKRDGLLAFDLTDPSNPIQSATYNTSTNQSGIPNTRDIFITGGHAYAADRNAGLMVFDLNADGTLTPVSQMPISQAAQRVRVQDGLAFISGLTALFIADVTNPSAPVIIAEIPEPSGTEPYTLTAHLHNDLLYTADVNNGYRIFDLQDPSDPLQLAQFDADVTTKQGSFDGFVYDFLFENEIMHIGLSSGGLATYDNTDPLNPLLLKHFPASFVNNTFSSRFRELSIRGRTLIASAGMQGIIAFDLNECIACPIDLNGDGVLNFFDVTLFIEAFVLGDPIADLNQDSMYNFFDVAAFIADYNAGCP